MVKIILFFTALELLVTIPIGITAINLGDGIFVLPLFSMISMIFIFIKTFIICGLYSTADEDGSIERSAFQDAYPPLIMLFIIQLFPILIISAVSGDSRSEMFLPFVGYLAFKFALDALRIIIYRHISK